MTAQILDGKKAAEEIRASLKKEISCMPKKPGLAAIIVGDNPASKLYVGIKRKTCDEVGIYSELHELPEATSEEDLLKLIRKLNGDEKINGILIQLPLPKHINEENIFSEIALEKDVDGFHAVNMGRLMRAEERVVPCTPKGVIRLLEKYNIEIKGKNVVIVGRSKIVGRPLALMLLNRDATVTICHTKTQNCSEKTRMADILIGAAGCPKLIRADMVKDGAVVVDIGTTKVENKLVGDVDFDSVKGKASWITPVPGGIGPMTVAMLLENTVQAAKREK
ncbi:bifunctional methylenetetrahydrofolate dehydrogenase/methenyltetrahydrofolate cyclohydrolase FolD [Candidatus Woesearchaeota archaeon]|nr:bifunctional methylenetetrahydrofolate dehydrogenase/methenyltetrahydrofolate cyclohydrolase FolD [Candidatus Woesearchaeota archaeon]